MAFLGPVCPVSGTPCGSSGAGADPAAEALDLVGRLDAEVVDGGQAAVERPAGGGPVATGERGGD
jgi:hypothetical protein